MMTIEPSYHSSDLTAINTFYGRFGKPMMDRAGGFVLLVFASPLLLITAAAVTLSSPGPVLYRQVRLGRHRRPFYIYKFRSMVVQNDDPAKQAYLDDPRITRVGRLIRRVKLDELPQIWHVLTGDMSLVGPRPTLPEQMQNCTPSQLIRYEVLPGLTGWAQVNGNVLLSVYDRREHDVYYVKHLSLLFDLRILLMTIAVVLFGEKVKGRAW